MDGADTTVAGVVAPLDPAGLFHAVDKARDADRLDLEEFGEPRLRDALVLDRPDEQPPLRR